MNLLSAHKDSVEKCRSTDPKFHHARSYDANFKLMVMNHTEDKSNSAAGKKYGVTKCNIHRWQRMKGKLRNENSIWKTVAEPRKGPFHELELCVIPYMHEKHEDSSPIMQEVICMKALDLSCQMHVPRNTGKFKASTRWCICTMRQAD
jgi:hypothetical protein